MSQQSPPPNLLAAAESFDQEQAAQHNPVLHWENTWFPVSDCRSNDPLEQSSHSFVDDNVPALLNGSCTFSDAATPINSALTWNNYAINSGHPSDVNLPDCQPGATDHWEVERLLLEHQQLLPEDTDDNSSTFSSTNDSAYEAWLDSYLDGSQASMSSHFGSEYRSDYAESSGGGLSLPPLSRSHSSLGDFVGPLGPSLERVSGPEAYDTPATGSPTSLFGPVHSNSDLGEGNTPSPEMFGRQEGQWHDESLTQPIEFPPGHVDPQILIPFSYEPEKSTPQDLYTIQLMNALHSNGYRSVQLMPTDRANSKRRIDENDESAAPAPTGDVHKRQSPRKRARTDDLHFTKEAAIAMAEAIRKPGTGCIKWENGDTTTWNTSPLRENSKNGSGPEPRNVWMPWDFKGKEGVVSTETAFSEVNLFTESEDDEGPSKGKAKNRTLGRKGKKETRRKSPKQTYIAAYEHPLPSLSQEDWCLERDNAQTRALFEETFVIFEGVQFPLDHNDIKTWGTLSRPAHLGLSNGATIGRSSHGLGTTGKFICLICEAEYQLSDTQCARGMERHLRTHAKCKPLPCPAKDCKQEYARSDAITRHVKSGKVCSKKIALKEVKAGVNLKSRQWKSLAKWCVKRAADDKIQEMKEKLKE